MIPENDAEKRVLAAFRAGKREVLVKGEVIGGDFLRWLFLGEDDKKAGYRGTCIVGAIISDVLNMEFCEAKFPVRFRNCSFASKIKLQQLTCPELGFSGCTLKKGIDALCAKVAGNVFLNTDDSDSKDIKEFKAEGEVRLAGADIGGQLSCTGGSFENEGGDAFDAQSIKVAGGMFLCGEFKGEANLACADIGGQLVCVGGSFQNKGKIALSAYSIKVAGTVHLSDGFNAEGEVSLASADVGGQLVCTGGSFQNKEGDALNAQGIKVAADVVLRDGFNAEGEVSLAGADVGGQFACAGGSFQNKEGNALNAQGIKVTGDLILHTKVPHGEFKAMGVAWLVGAKVGGQLSCTGGGFQAINARSIKVDNQVVIRNFSADDLVFFANATIGGNLVLNSCKLTHLSLAGANVLGEFQDDADVYKSDKGGGIDLDIDGFRYQRLKIVGDDDGLKEAAVKKRIEWAGLMSRDGDFFPQPYEQLMNVFRAAGHTNWARDVGFALEQKRQEVMKSWLWKVWYSVLRTTIGYGYKPFRFFGWFFGIIFLGGVLFSGLPCGVSLEKTFSLWRGVTVEASKNHWNQCEALRMHPTHQVVYLDSGEKTGSEEHPGNYPQFIPLLYATETAFPLFPLGQTGNWHPAAWWVKFIQWFITLLGTVVLAILVLYGAGLLGPRWRDE